MFGNDSRLYIHNEPAGTPQPNTTAQVFRWPLANEKSVHHMNLELNKRGHYSRFPHNLINW